MDKKRRPSEYIRLAAFLLLGVYGLSACSDDEILPKEAEPEEEVPATPTNEANQYVNSWIRENMSYWYLWNEHLPSTDDKNADPETYFGSLLHADDRFSWIQDNYVELLNSLQGISKEAGYEFVLYREKEGSENVILQIVYIKPESPAATAGLKRGDIVSHINGQQLTIANYQTLLAAVRENQTLRYQPLLTDAQAFGDAKDVSLSTVEYTENPNYLHKVIQAGNKKIGYFVYNFFASGTDSQPGKYDSEMDAIFGTFKSQGIDELVVDLRYNSGGSESAARNLASLIGRGVDQSKVFLKRRYNSIVQKEILEDDNLGEDFLVSRYATDPNNIGNALASGRVYILTSSRTASASELIINSLRPYMEVFLIGDTTYGKNVGSISIFEEDDQKNTWGMQPIVVKVYNSLDESDYSKGFTPDVPDLDNSLHLFPLGDPRETLLSLAIAEITGTSSTARQDRPRRNPIGHSLDLKRRSYTLSMDESRLLRP